MKVILFTFIFIYVLDVFAQSRRAILEDKKAAEILDKYADAIGGKEKWRSIMSFVEIYQSTTIGSIIPTITGEANHDTIFEKVEVCYLLPDYYKIKTIKESDTTSIFITPKQGWEQINSFRGFKINEKLRSMYAQNIILMEVLLINSNALYKGKEVIKNRDCNKIEINYKDRNYFYFFDEISGLLIMAKSINSTSEVYYSDYRRIGDFLLPYCHTLIRDGKSVNIINRAEVKFNEKLSRDMFLPLSEK